MQVPDDVVEQVAAHLADLTVADHVGPHARNVRPEAGPRPAPLRDFLGGSLLGFLARLVIRGRLVRRFGLCRSGVGILHRHVVHQRPARPRGPAAELRSRRQIDQTGRDVVRHRVVAGPYLGRRHPHDVVEGQGREQVEVRGLSLGVDLPRDRELDDVVRIQPVGVAPARRGEVGRLGGRPVPLRRAAVDPGHDRLDLVVAQADVVGELAEAPVGEPRRHLAGDDLRLDGPRPRPRVAVRQQRHRRHLVRPVAARAVVEQDLPDVLVVCRCPFGCPRGTGRE